MPKPGQKRRPGPSGNELGRAVLRAERESWPTPTKRDAHGAWGRTHKASGGSNLPTAVRDATGGRPGQLNPEWVEWLMGFPVGWTALPPSETPSSRRSPSGSAAESSSGRRATEASSPRSKVSRVSEKVRKKYQLRVIVTTEAQARAVMEHAFKRARGKSIEVIAEEVRNRYPHVGVEYAAAVAYTVKGNSSLDIKRFGERALADAGIGRDETHEIQVSRIGGAEKIVEGSAVPENEYERKPDGTKVVGVQPAIDAGETGPETAPPNGQEPTPDTTPTQPPSIAPAPDLLQAAAPDPAVEPRAGDPIPGWTPPGYVPVETPGPGAVLVPETCEPTNDTEGDTP